MTNQVATLKMGQRFKRTPAGEIPLDWDARDIESLTSSMVNGGTPDRKVEKYWRGDIPWITGADFANQNVAAVRRYITKEAVQNSSTNVVPKGAVLVVTRTGVGKLAVADRDIAISQDITGIIPDADTILSEFLFWELILFAPQLKATHQGTSISGVLRSDLERLIIPVPPLAEQKKIVEILSVFENAIKKTNSVIEKAEALKLGLMQQLFTKGMTGHEKFKTTELGRIPDSWDLKSCESMCELITVGIVVQPARLYVESGIPCLRSLNVLEDSIADDRMVFISSKANEAHTKSRLQEGDVVAVRTGYPGTSCVVPKKYDGANCVDLVVMRPGKRLAGTYLSRFINSPAGRKQVLRGQGGLAQQHFNVGEVCKMLIPVPPMGEQHAISDFLIVVDNAISTEARIKKNLETLRNGLMKVLLLGKIRVSA